MTKISTLLCRLLGAILLPLLEGLGFAAEKQPDITMLGQRVEHRATLLAIDDASLPLRKNLGLYLSKPKVRAEAVLKPSSFGSGAPDDLAAHFYGTVLQDGDKFRMWYYACHWGKNPDWSPRLMQQVAKASYGPLYQGPLCYAESDDGITWKKPELGQVLFKGSSKNNALALPHTVVSGAIVIKDAADPNPARRYKMTYQFFPEFSQPTVAEYGRQPSVALAVSPDGLKWQVIGIPFRNQFVEPSSFVKHAGHYVIHYQAAGSLGGYFAEGGTSSGRTGVARITMDFARWPDALAEAFALAEPEDKSKRGLSGDYDQAHLGVGAASFGNVCVGLYGLWHNANFSQAFDQISCDFGLLVSNDGVKFREPVKGHRFLRREDSLVTPVPGRDFNTILCQANGILNVGDETRIYHGRWRNAAKRAEKDDLKHYYAEVALATLPRDRWGALGLHPGANEGTVWTAPMTINKPGCEVTLNADGVQGMSVEIADGSFALLPEYSGANAGIVSAKDGLDCQVKWPKASLDALVGKTVRLRFQLKKGDHVEPRLFAAHVTVE
ncbi:MAG: hypothetical protein HZA92_13070 [Verrucomicrobia bacterium]|nr:hypothetical protein [Verrucomicrobiota bacterium]